jgi:hypothetical protein
VEFGRHDEASVRREKLALGSNEAIADAAAKARVLAPASLDHLNLVDIIRKAQSISISSLR